MLLPVLALMMLDDAVDIKALASQVEPKRLQATVEHLAAMPTRNTNTEGMAQAIEWLAGEYRKIPGIQVEIMKYPIQAGRRVVADKDVVQLIATLPGKSDRRIMVGGHIDTINMTQGADPMTARAPGADDDASGVALALEIARVLSAKKWDHTLCFIAFSGEEQALLGSRALAKRAKDENWKVDAVFSNDIVGSSSNEVGQKDDKHIRVFSEETQPKDENHHESRELARFLEWVTRKKLKNFDVKLIFRHDRFGRGGDHTSFNQLGFNALRFTEMNESYTHQHTENDLPEFMDFNYLANVTRINLMGMATLANAGAPPTGIRVDTRQNHDTTLSWKAAPDTKYVIYYRETTAPVWEKAIEVGAVNTYVVKGVSKDDYTFAIGAEGGIPVEAR